MREAGRRWRTWGVSLAIAAAVVASAGTVLLWGVSGLETRREPQWLALVENPDEEIARSVCKGQVRWLSKRSDPRQESESLERYVTVLDRNPTDWQIVNGVSLIVARQRPDLLVRMLHSNDKRLVYYAGLRLASHETESLREVMGEDDIQRVRELATRPDPVKLVFVLPVDPAAKEQQGRTEFGDVLGRPFLLLTERLSARGHAAAPPAP